MLFYFLHRIGYSVFVMSGDKKTTKEDSVRSSPEKEKSGAKGDPKAGGSRSKSSNSKEVVTKQSEELAAQMSKLPKIPKLVIKTVKDGEAAQAGQMDRMAKAMEAQGEQMKLLMGTMASFMETSMESNKRRAPPPEEMYQESEGHSSEATDCLHDDRENFFDEEGEEAEEDHLHLGEEVQVSQASVLDSLGSGHNSHAPSKHQVDLWSRVVKLDEARFGEAAWRKLKIGSIVTKWTSHPSAAPFSAPRADSNLVPLKFADQRALEKQMIALQTAVGSMGAITSKIIGLMEDKARVLEETAQQYKDGAVIIETPREEAADIMLSIQSSIMGTYVKDMVEVLRVSGAMFNNMTHEEVV